MASTKKKNHPSLSDNFTKRILKMKDQSIAVAHLRASLVGDDTTRTPHLDYHLHFLCYESEAVTGVVCLDTSDFLESDRATFGEVSQSLFMKEIVKTFASRMNTYFSQKELVRDSIFIKAPDRLWVQFNQLKESLYFEHMDLLQKHSLAKEVKASSSNLIQEEQFPFEENLQKGKIRYGIYETRKKKVLVTK
jgi:hypothetical protein